MKWVEYSERTWGSENMRAVYHCRESILKTLEMSPEVTVLNACISSHLEALSPWLMSFTQKWQGSVKGKQGIFEKAVLDLHTWESLATVKYLCILKANLLHCYFRFKMCKLSDEWDNQAVFFPFRHRTFELFCLLTGPWSTSKLSKDKKGNSWQGPHITKNMSHFFFYGLWTLIWLQELWMEYCSDRDCICSKALWIWLT